MTKESDNSNPLLIDGLSVERIPKKKRPTTEDWVQVQGGMPEIQWENGNVCKVVHRYVNHKDKTGTGSVVTVSLPILDKMKMKTVTYNIDGADKDFPIALLWKFIGKPNWIISGGRGCEKVVVE